MNNFKRLMALMLVLVVAVSFAACSGNTNTTGSTTTAPTSTAPTTTAPTTSTGAQKQITYRVRVVDEDGNPVVGAWVQLCLDACRLDDTDEEGWAEFDNKVEDGYKANVASGPDNYEVPEGKKVDDTAYYFENGVLELTLVLKLIDA